MNRLLMGRKAMTTHVNFKLLEPGQEYRLCATVETGLVLGVFRKNKVQGETALQYGGPRFRYVVRKLEKIHEEKFRFKEML